jgi:hypothetical protein
MDALHSSLHVQGIQRYANAHAEQDAEHHGQDKEPHVTAPLAVGAREQNSFQIRSTSFHIQQSDRPVNLPSSRG